MPKLSVVIPVYNEPSLQPLFERLLAVEDQLKRIALDCEFIFVDDGSDSLHAWEELKEFKAEHSNVKAIRFARNFGAFHAIKAGFGFVSGDCFATLSADLQDPPELLVEMAQKWQDGAKFVICAREGREDPLATRAFASLYYKLIRLMAIKDFPASGYDLALMDKSLLPHLQKTSVMINYRLLAFWLGFNPEVIYYKRAERLAGESHWGLGKRINLFLDSLLAFSIWPARAILYTGGIISLLALAILVWQFASYLAAGAANNYMLFGSVLGFGFGLLLLALGLVAEYLWRIYSLAADIPEIVIDEII